uniref:Uncharacterized protein n=1 Tax=viral metagenome TaxID=1070528 RepID=A0A6C0C311_9ZZZZ
MKTKKRGGKSKTKHGGNLVGGLLSVIKQALPSYLLYQAVRMQQDRKKRKSRKGGPKSRRGGGSKTRRRGGKKKRK